MYFKPKEMSSTKIYDLVVQGNFTLISII